MAFEFAEFREFRIGQGRAAALGKIQPGQRTDISILSTTRNFWARRSSHGHT
jgi:hypothetical protein